MIKSNEISYVYFLKKVHKKIPDRTYCQGRAFTRGATLFHGHNHALFYQIHLDGPFDTLHLHSILSIRNSLLAHVVTFLPCHRLYDKYTPSERKMSNILFFKIFYIFLFTYKFYCFLYIVYEYLYQYKNTIKKTSPPTI